jgi:hypothetical protein
VRVETKLCTGTVIILCIILFGTTRLKVTITITK